MGVFDFVKNAGAKIGIGKSTGEEAAEEVFEANKPMLTDPDLIFLGQVDRILQ